ncbi:MAG: S49 family peptidase [Exilibacterium sp.]
MISWIRTSIANLLFVAILVLIVITLLPQEAPQLAEKGALRLAPSGVLVDQRSYIEPLQQLLGDSQRLDSETLVRDLVNAINYAAKDKRITTLVLELDHLAGGGISKLEEIGIALTTFKATGKSIIAVSDSYSQEQYYLASYANEIYLHPMGTVALTGYGAYRNYFKSALEKLAVNFHVFRVGQYKDFVEPYTRNGMSDASREHNTQWLNELKTRLEMRRDLIAKIGADKEGNNYQAVSFKDYLTLIESKKAHHKDQVGLLVAQGTIIDGEQPSGNIGGDTLA